MIFDLQRAGTGKRIAAFLFDAIVFAVLATGIGFLLSMVTGYDRHSAKLQESYSKYEEEYGVTFNIDSTEYYAMDEAQRENYQNAVDALAADADADAAFRTVASLVLVITTASLLLGYLTIDVLFPFIFGNGQTPGKKIFGIGIISPDGIRASRFQIFTRAILAKFTVETMIPVLLIMLFIFSNLNLMLLILLLFGIGVLQLILFFSTRNHALIHDLIAGTVAVDLQSQLVFDNEEEKRLFEERISGGGPGTPGD